MSCSARQHEEYSNNLIQVSVDGLNWITVWKANFTVSYDEVAICIIPLAIKFYLDKDIGRIE